MLKQATGTMILLVYVGSMHVVIQSSDFKNERSLFVSIPASTFLAILFFRSTLDRL